MATKVRWLGHAFFEITTQHDRTILIDPYIEENPATPEGVIPDEANMILITHDHFDHLESVASLLGPEGIIFAQPEIIAKIKNENPELEDSNFVNEGIGMNIGGTVEYEGIKITMVQAFHSSGVGNPAGFIIRLTDGKTIYYAGDTGVFSSMELFNELYDINLALLPIGSVFTMDPAQASIATRLLQPDIVIPMHYGTFPILVDSADEFIELVKNETPDTEVKPINPGESYLLK